MESKEDVVSLSGLNSSDKIETVKESNGLNSVDDSKVSSLIVSSDDENEGFASGQEEAFETNLDESLGLGKEALENVDEGEESFLETSEFPVSKVESEAVDDAEKGGKLVMEGEKDEKFLENSDSNRVKVDEIKEDKVGEIKENKVDEATVLKSESGEEVKSGGSEIGRNDLGMEGEKDEKFVENLDSNGEIKEDKVDEEVKFGGSEIGGNDLVESNGVKVTPEGDVIVEKVEIETPAPGVVVVAASNTDEEDEISDEDDVVLVGGAEDAKVTSEGDSVVEAIDVDVPLPGVAGVAVVTAKKEEEEEDGSSEKLDSVLEQVVAKEAVGVTEGAFSPLNGDDSEVKENGPVVQNVLDGLQGDSVQETETLVKELTDDLTQETEVLGTVKPDDNVQKTKPDEVQETKPDEVQETKSDVVVEETKPDVVQETKPDVVQETKPDEVQETKPDVQETKSDEVQETKPDEVEETKSDEVVAKAKDLDLGDNGPENEPADKFILEESVEKEDGDEEEDGSEDEETDDVIFGSSKTAKQFMEEMERGSGGESSQDRSQLDGQIVTDSDEEDDEDEEDGKELFDSAALAALLKAAAEGGSEGGGNITFSSQDGSRLFTVERPAGLGPSLQSARPAPRPVRSNIFGSAINPTATETNPNLTDEERKKLEKLQSIRVKFLRLVQRLGLSTDESVAAQVLYRLALIAGRQTTESFSLESAKRKATELESEGKENLDFSINILVIGKAGVGKSATINSIFGEDKTQISAFQPATSSVKEIRGSVGGVSIRVFDTPGLRASVMDQSFNRRVLASAKRCMKKNPPDIVLYVDRLDAQTRDHNDLPLLKTITSSLGSTIWRSAIVTLTHGASAPPEGQSGTPLSYEMFVTQRSHVVQQAIGQSVGDLRMMSPSLMNPVTLVENHESCRKNREGLKVLPNGQTWRPQLLMLCYSMKILAEANGLSKAQDFDNRKLFGFRVRAPPLPYMLSSMLQSRAHPKLGDGGGDSDGDVADLSDSDGEEDEDEYDQLPPFKPLKKTQLAKLSREQRKAYFDEYDYRVKLLQKKQWREEVKRMKEMKKRGGSIGVTEPNLEEDGEGDAPAPVAVPLPDMALPPSFDSDNPAYRFRFLEPTSQFLARPVLDTHGWDHDCGYDGVNVEQTLAIANQFPAAVSVQVTKDKKDFSINLDSSISTKHGENGSSMAGFDIQPIGKQLAYIVRGETKFKNLKKNKTAAGVSVTFLGENTVTGFKVEDQISFAKQYSIIASAGTVRFQTDSAYGANIEVQRRELDYPIGQVQSTIGVSIIKWRGDLALGFNGLAQFAAGRNSKVAVRAGVNNKMSGQITVKTSSSEYLSLALAAVVPAVISAYKKYTAGGGGGGYSGY